MDLPDTKSGGNEPGGPQSQKLPTENLQQLQTAEEAAGSGLDPTEDKSSFKSEVQKQNERADIGSDEMQPKPQGFANAEEGRTPGSLTMDTTGDVASKNPSASIDTFQTTVASSPILVSVSSPNTPSLSDNVTPKTTSETTSLSSEPVERLCETNSTPQALENGHNDVCHTQDDPASCLEDDDGQEFQTFSQQYFDMEKKGEVTIEYTYQFLMARKTDEERLRKRQQLVSADEEDDAREFESAKKNGSLFIEEANGANDDMPISRSPPCDDEDAGEEEGGSDNESDSDNEDCSEYSESESIIEKVQTKLRKADKVKSFSETAQQPKKKPTAKRARLPKMKDKDLQESMAVGLEVAMKPNKNRKRTQGERFAKGTPTAKRQKLTHGDGEQQRDSKTRAPKNSDAGSKKPRGRPKKSKVSAAEGRVQDLAGLANPSVATTSDETMPNQPKFTDNRKMQVIAEILASLPTDGIEMEKLDLNSLKKANLKFTKPRSVRPVPPDQWRVTGMTGTLHNFQLIGVSRMREMERRPAAASMPHGGIIADKMGLGKTIQMIANIVDGQNEPAASQRGTLVIVPPSLLQQWHDEIEKHVEGETLPLVITFDGKLAYRGRSVVQLLQQAQIVLATYSDLRASFPKFKAPENLAEDEKEEWCKENFEKRGPLHRVSWLRVVLDECQQIKNPETFTAIAARALIAKHRWLMSGTLITNNVTELYSYLKFLRAPLAANMELFKQNFLRDDKCKERLRRFMTSCLIWRTYEDTFLGAPIVKMPPSKTVLVPVYFSRLEKEIYEFVCEKACQGARTLIQTEEPNSRNLIWQVWLRVMFLRQISSHFLCARDTLKRYMSADEIRKLEALCRSYDQRSENAAIQNLSNTLKELEAEIIADNNEGGNSLELDPVDVTHQDESTEDASSSKDDFCAGCTESLDQYWRLQCGHAICDDCNAHLLLSADNEEKAAICPNSECLGGLENAQQDEVPSIRSRLRNISHNNVPKRVVRKKRGTKLNEDSLVLFSSKIRLVKATIMNCKAKDPGIKIVIFVQFIKLIGILTNMCKAEGWSCHPYHGSMTMKARDTVLHDFREEAEGSILIASLTAGGVGLNLTQATTVLLVDLYWNEAIEQQAYARVYRIGQQHPTTFYRFPVQGSVDDMILKMQKRKKRDIDAVMSTKQTDLPNISELMALFEPRPEISEDDDEVPGGINVSSEDMRRVEEANAAATEVGS